jgi:hypothetical protein
MLIDLSKVTLVLQPVLRLVNSDQVAVYLLVTSPRLDRRTEINDAPKNMRPSFIGAFVNPVILSGMARPSTRRTLARLISRPLRSIYWFVETRCLVLTEPF